MEQHVSKQDAAVAHCDDNVDISLDKGNLLQEAQDATEHERNMSLSQGFKLYPKAIGWSIVLSTAVVMEGFDTILMNSFYAYPEFEKKYGTLGSDGSYSIPASWQSALSNGARIGEIIGLFFNGIVSEKYGYRVTMLGSLVSLAAFIFIPFFAQNIQTLMAGQILLGIPWGVFQTLTTVYASEVCPVQLRSYLTTYVNLCWVIGQLIGTGALRGLLNRPDEWAYRIPFALQWLWPVPLAIGVFLAPESPWWLIRSGRLGKAEHALKRLTTTNDPSFDAKKTVAMMLVTIEHEKEITAGATYLDCFKGVELRRTEVTCLIWAAQSLSGSAIMSWSTYFFKQAGLSSTDAFDMSLGQFAIGFVGTIFSWFLMRFFGRRTLFVGGLICLDTMLLIIGFTGIAPKHDATYWATGSMLLVFTFIYDCTVGSVVYSLVSELSSVRLRAKTVVLARILFNVASIINAVITPYMLNPDAWNWKAKSGFFWAGICFIWVVWSFFRVPEPKGRTYGELDILFEQRVPARQFHKTAVVQREHTIRLDQTQ